MKSSDLIRGTVTRRVLSVQASYAAETCLGSQLVTVSDVCLLLMNVQSPLASGHKILSAALPGEPTDPVVALDEDCNV